MIYDVVLVSAPEQSESVIHTHISTLFLDSVAKNGHSRVWSRVPVLSSSLLLVAALLTIVRTWTQTKRPSAEQWIKVWLHIQWNIVVAVV